MDKILELTEVFKALSDPTRLRLVKLLNDHEGALCVNALANRLEVSQSAVSQHLKILRQIGLVRGERKGYWIPYAINEDTLENCRRILNEVCSCGCEGRGNFREIELECADAELLKKYERELQGELEAVRKRLSQMESP